MRWAVDAVGAGNRCRRKDRGSDRGSVEVVVEAV
jgi:hypothetical protein